MKITNDFLEEQLLELFGRDWKNKYELNKNNLGYAFYILVPHRMALHDGRFSAKEMMIYLQGMLDYKNGTSRRL